MKNIRFRSFFNRRAIKITAAGTIFSAVIVSITLLIVQLTRPLPLNLLVMASLTLLLTLIVGFLLGLILIGFITIFIGRNSQILVANAEVPIKEMFVPYVLNSKDVEDIIQSRSYLYKHSAISKIYRVIGGALIFGASIDLVLFVTMFVFSLSYIWIFAAIGVIALTISYLLFHRSTPKKRNKFYVMLAKQAQGLAGEHTVTVSTKGISDSSGANKESIEWKSIYELVPEKPYFYVLTKDNRILVIPEKAFEDRSKFLEFIQFARDCFLNSKNESKT
jgi:hypothetical protein